MRRAHHILLLGPDRPLRAALAEQFSADPDLRVSVGEAGLAEVASVDAAVVLALPDVAAALPDQGLNGPIFLLGEARDGGDAVTSVPLPLRYAQFAATLRAKLRAHEHSDDGARGFSGYLLRAADRVLETPGGEIIRLTDKEADILRYLHRAAGAPVAREALLGEVWGYQSGVTTHTLETHVYRLRQKIEPQMGKTRLLLTVEGGYRLAMEAAVDDGPPTRSL